MSVRDMWHRTQVYFGIKEEDWDDEYFDDDGSAAHEDLESRYNERPNVRRLNPRRRAGVEFDEIFSDEPQSGRGRGRGRPTQIQNGGQRHAAQVELIVPKSFNDAQKVADKLKADVPVIINLQTADSDLAKRLIDFSSGLTYALDGSMQRVADRVFLLTPAHVKVSAEDKASLMERGFFNQY
ncbi:MAG: cell division inhibitor SepF [Gaiellales bacterium]|jgi:cell division inhibitor SepF|nr:cell division inhibitor SepF [Gaiellales bacterium]